MAEIFASSGQAMISRLVPRILFCRYLLEQLLGLADALDQMHKRNWRHGDIKPENILNFKNCTIIGQLKLGDMGLAKHHITATSHCRGAPTATKFGTTRYEPPDEIIPPGGRGSKI